MRVHCVHRWSESYEMLTATLWHCTSCRRPCLLIRGGTGCVLCTKLQRVEKVVFVVAALLRMDDGLLEQYVAHQFFPVSYLRCCSLMFVQSEDDVVRSFFRQAQERNSTQRVPHGLRADGSAERLVLPRM